MMPEHVNDSSPILTDRDPPPPSPCQTISHRDFNTGIILWQVIATWETINKIMDFLCVKIWVAFRFDHLKIIFNKLSEVSNPYLFNPKLLIDRGYLCSLRQEQNKRGFNILFVKLIDGDKKISDVFITPFIMTRGYQSNIVSCSVMNSFCCLHHKL